MGYISSCSNYGFSTECSREQCLFERKRVGEEERTIIDYANDQLDECSSDSSSAANVIAVWQFAAVQVHLTRFKNREKKGGPTGNRSARASSVARLLIDSPEWREYRQKLASPSHRHGECLILVGVILFLIYGTGHKEWQRFRRRFFSFRKERTLGNDCTRVNPRGDEQRDIEIKSAPSRQDTNQGEHVESDGVGKRAQRRSTRWSCESHTSAGLPRVEFRPLLPSLRSSTSSRLFRIWTNYADGGVRGDFDSPRSLARPDMSDFTWGIRELEKLTRPDVVECQLFRRELRLPQAAESKQYIPHEYILLTDRNDTSGRSFNRCESPEAFLISEVFQVLGGYWIPKSNICRKITMNHQPQQLSHREFPTMMTRPGRAKQKQPQVRF
ncbi:hypothetical protein ALC62_02459 [Cyphomyrmex costatus]|uniref:Uncharacterized protein n=1 Tax=Cyphomyrmex costatus TaxID=456900 RepID=A0A195D119_9HYME|nr:hypothetical protein ALC62_02459 [Cyphomyrmex costatus]